MISEDFAVVLIRWIGVVLHQVRGGLMTTEEEVCVDLEFDGYDLQLPFEVSTKFMISTETE